MSMEFEQLTKPLPRGRRIHPHMSVFALLEGAEPVSLVDGM